MSHAVTPVQKLKKQGNDVREGDAAKIIIGATELHLIDAKNGAYFNQLFTKDIEVGHCMAHTHVH